MSKRCLIIFCLVLFSFPLGAAASEHPFGLNKNHPYGRLTTDYVTPHIPWANPYYQGKVKVLVLAPTWSQRETVELAQRLSLDFTAWMTASFHEVVFPRSPDRAFAFFQPPSDLVYRLLEKYLEKDYDAIIIGKLDWEMLPAKRRFELLKKVFEGTGLIYINPPEHKELNIVFKGEKIPEGLNFITDNLPLSFLPRFKGIKKEDLVKATTFGKGRVVILNYHEPSPPKEGAEAWHCLTPMWELANPQRGFPSNTLPEVELVSYEYYQALVAKAVLWASKKQPEVQIKGIGLTEKINWPVSEKGVVIELGNLPANALVKAAVRQREVYERVYPLSKKKAEEKTTFSLPNLPAGNYFLDVWILASDGKRILNWGSKGFSVISDFEFGEITLDKSSFDIGDTIDGKVVLPRLLKENEKIIVSLWDNYNRKIESKELKANTLSAPFHFTPLKPLTTLHRVEVQLIRDKKIVCEKKLQFPVRAKLRWDDFNEIVWADVGNNFFITHLMLRKLASFDEADVLLMPHEGFGFQIHPAWELTEEESIPAKIRLQTCARNTALANLSLMPYNWRFMGGGGEDINKTPRKCLSNPEFRKKIANDFDIDAEIYGPYGPFCWVHGNESIYSHKPDDCWCKYCLAGLRKFLQSRHGTLEALNSEWGTNYNDWDSVIPFTFKQAKGNINRAAGWVEHRLFNNTLFSEIYNYAEQIIQKNDPGARTGFDGPHGITFPNSGLDWWLSSRQRGVLQSYIMDSGNMEVFRSFATQNQVTGMWYGTYGLTWQIGPNTVPFCHFFPWYSLFHQLNTTWFWYMGSPGPNSGYAPDLTSLPFFAARTESLKKIKSGIGKLLLTGSRANDKIAIHYSEVSRIVDSLYALKEDDWSRGWYDALVSFNKALEDNGLQYDYLSYEQIEKGELIKRGFRVFIMPHSRAISEKEAEEIRKFVKNGGIVIADILPGILNEHGTLQKEGLLSGLFPADKTGKITFIGKGKTILIGDLLSGYGKAHMNQYGWKGLEGRWHLLGKLLERQAGIVPEVKVIPLRAKEIPPTEITRIKCGDTEFIGLLRQYFLYDNASYPVEILFPYKSHLYDVLTGKYLGFTDRVNTDLSYRVKLYALSPYKVNSIALTLPSVAISGTATSLQITLKTEGNTKPSRHAFRLEVITPDGSNLPYYAQNIIAEDGTASGEIPWALNDKPGKYTISVQDVMSGVSIQKTITLK